MKKLCLFLLVSTLFTGVIKAQVVGQATLKKKVLTKPIPPPPLPPPPAPKPSPVYSLTGVVVKVGTGADSKESPSEVTLNLFNTTTGKICFQQVSPINTLFASGSELEFRLVKFSKAWVPEQQITASLLLSSLQANGMRLEVSYTPNFFLDAWAIRGVALTLEFKDQFGNPHPTLNEKMISFASATGMLDQGRQTIKCMIDGNLNALSATIN